MAKDYTESAFVTHVIPPLGDRGPGLNDFFTKVQSSIRSYTEDDVTLLRKDLVIHSPSPTYSRQNLPQEMAAECIFSFQTVWTEEVAMTWRKNHFNASIIIYKQWFTEGCYQYQVDLHL
jgi:hypothetical protein